MTPEEKEQIINTFKEARNFISDPERWTKGTSARSINGVPIHPLNHNATCWCSFGAIEKVVSDSNRRLVHDICWLTKYTGVSYIEYNDLPETTHEDIMKMFDGAIALVEKEP